MKILLTLWAIYIIANFKSEGCYSQEDLNELHPNEFDSPLRD